MANLNELLIGLGYADRLRCEVKRWNLAIKQGPGRLSGMLEPNRNRAKATGADEQ
jgi:hypothetical protein